MRSSSDGSKFERAVQEIVSRVANQHIKDGQVLGLGSGSTVAKFAKVLGERIRKESLTITIVPSSMQAWLLAQENRLSYYFDFAHCPKSLDIVVDGADQIGVRGRSMIKGGGGALLREKIILSSSKRSFILADSSKFSEFLNRSVPLEVIQFAVQSVERHVRENFGGKSVLRKLDKGYPFYTESGNVILDCHFKGPLKNPLQMERELKGIPGVVEAGIFNCKIDAFYRANQDGTFEKI